MKAFHHQLILVLSSIVSSMPFSSIMVIRQYLSRRCSLINYTNAFQTTTRSTNMHIYSKRKASWTTTTTPTVQYKWFGTTTTVKGQESSNHEVAQLESTIKNKKNGIIEVEEPELANKMSQKEFESILQSKELTKTIIYPTVLVPSDQLSRYITKPTSIRKYFAKPLEGIHPQIKLVQSSPDHTTQKMILLEPATLLHDISSLEEDMPEGICLGPEVRVTLTAKNIPLSEILESILPKSVHPVPVSFEQLGSIAHYNLKAHHLPYKYSIGQAHLFKHGGSSKKNKENVVCKTVVNKIGDVEGIHRTFPFEVIASSAGGSVAKNDDEAFRATFVETSTTISFDLRKVYWSSRLSGERRRLIEEEFLPKQYIADACCGVGAVCIQAAVQKGCRIVANDINPFAVQYTTDNASRNGIKGKKNFWVECGDARDFIRDLPMKSPYKFELPDHLLINLPTLAPTFLNTLRFWPTKGIPTKQRPTRVHVYTFAKSTESSTRTVEEVAIDLVANGLLPESVPSTGRGTFLNKLGCFVQTKEVKEVAPSKHCVCVSFFATPRLIRHMKGDFVDF